MNECKHWSKILKEKKQQNNELMLSHNSMESFDCDLYYIYSMPFTPINCVMLQHIHIHNDNA